MNNKNLALAKVDFQGLKKFARQGELIVAISDDMTNSVWVFATKTMPIFDFGSTKIFKTEETGMVEVMGQQSGDDFFIHITGVRVKKIYDFSWVQ